MLIVCMLRIFSKKGELEIMTFDAIDQMAVSTIRSYGCSANGLCTLEPCDEC